MSVCGVRVEECGRNACERGVRRIICGMYNLPARKSQIRMVVLNSGDEVRIEGYFGFVKVMGSGMVVEIRDEGLGESFVWDASDVLELPRGVYDIRVKNVGSGVVRVMYGKLV